MALEAGAAELVALAPSDAFVILVRRLPALAELELTDREREILSLLAAGERDQDIAEQLFISIATVRSHLDRIRDKTGCRRRPDLTRLAVEKGLTVTAGSRTKLR